MKKILHILCILATLYSGIVHAVVQENQPQFDDLSILVPSCDKYSELWQPFYAVTTQGLHYINLVNNSVLISDDVEFLAKHSFVVNNLPLNTDPKVKRKIFCKRIIGNLYAKAYKPAAEYIKEIVNKY
jgi:hypothetical protein